MGGAEVDMDVEKKSAVDEELACVRCGLDCDELVLSPRAHPLLDMALCVGCERFLEEREPWNDVDEDNYHVACLACGDKDGELALCDESGCCRVIHAVCLGRLVGEEEAVASVASEEAFACPVCAPTAMSEALAASARAALEALSSTPCAELELAIDDQESSNEEKLELAVSALLILESAIADCLEHLETESLDVVRQQVREELKASKPDELVVESEAKMVAASWERRLTLLRLRQPRLQELASRGCGVDLGLLYAKLDAMDATTARTTAWRRAPRSTLRRQGNKAHTYDDPADETAKKELLSAQAALDAAGRREAADGEGRVVNLSSAGAAGFQELRRAQLGSDLYDRCYDATAPNDAGTEDLLASIRDKMRAPEAELGAPLLDGEEDEDLAVTAALVQQDEESDANDEEEESDDDLFEVLDEGPPSHHGASERACLSALQAEDAMLAKVTSKVRRRTTAGDELVVRRPPPRRAAHPRAIHVAPPAVVAASSSSSSSSAEEDDAPPPVQEEEQEEEEEEAGGVSAPSPEKKKRQKQQGRVELPRRHISVADSDDDEEHLFQEDTEEEEEGQRSPSWSAGSKSEDDDESDASEDLGSLASPPESSSDEDSSSEDDAGEKKKKTRRLRRNKKKKDVGAARAELLKKRAEKAGETTGGSISILTGKNRKKAIIDIADSDDAASPKKKEASDEDPEEEDDDDDENFDVADDLCWTCGDPGELLMCECCPAVHHARCVGLRKIPDDDWYCARCTLLRENDGKKKKRGAYKKNKKKKKKKKKRKRGEESSSEESEDDDDDLVKAAAKRQATLGKLVATAGDTTKEARKRELARQAEIRYKGVQEDSEDEAHNKEQEDTELLIFKSGVAEDKREVTLRKGRTILKPHQRSGLKFVCENLLVSLAALRRGDVGFGAVIAHSMGLGKSLLVVSLATLILGPPTLNPVLHEALEEGKVRLDRILIITPASTLDNWVNELESWSSKLVGESNSLRRRIYPLSRLAKTLIERRRVLKQWSVKGGVLLLGYELFSSLLNARARRERNWMREHLAQAADVVIVDEAHRIKSTNARTYKALEEITTRRRLALTGTPIQNNLGEYYAMCSWVRPLHLDTRSSFVKRFEKPIAAGLYDDSTKVQVRRSKRKMALLHTLLEPCLHRRNADILAKALPPKVELVLYLRLTPIQKTLYNERMDLGFSGSVNEGGIFAIFEHMRQIFNHPNVALLAKQNRDLMQLEEKRQEKAEMDAFIADDDDDDEDDESEDEDENGEVAVAAVEEKKEEEVVVIEDEQRMNASEDWERRIMEPHVVLRPDDEEDLTESALYAACRDSDPAASAKTELTRDILQLARSRGEKVLIFSQSLRTLDYLEKGLVRKGLKWPASRCMRLDGGTAVQRRQGMIDTFNDDDTGSVTVFLLSNKAASVGINLVGATRVILFDVSWNPADDAQAIARAHRFGQRRPVFVYRLVASGTVEERVFHRQISKGAVASGVSDDEVLQRFFKKEQLHDLFPLAEEQEDDEEGVDEEEEEDEEEAEDAAAKRRKSTEADVPAPVRVRRVIPAKLRRTRDELFLSLAAKYEDKIARLRPFDTFAAADDDRISADEIAEALDAYENGLDEDTVIEAREQQQQQQQMEQMQQQQQYYPMPQQIPGYGMDMGFPPQMGYPNAFPQQGYPQQQMGNLPAPMAMDAYMMMQQQQQQQQMGGMHGMDAQSRAFLATHMPAAYNSAQSWQQQNGPQFQPPQMSHLGNTNGHFNSWQQQNAAARDQAAWEQQNANARQK